MVDRWMNGWMDGWWIDGLKNTQFALSIYRFALSIYRFALSIALSNRLNGQSKVQSNKLNGPIQGSIKLSNEKIRVLLLLYCLWLISFSNTQSQNIIFGSFQKLDQQILQIYKEWQFPRLFPLVLNFSERI